MNLLCFCLRHLIRREASDGEAKQSPYEPLCPIWLSMIAAVGWVSRPLVREL
jgi:hypothetical protein